MYTVVCYECGDETGLEGARRGGGGVARHNPNLTHCYGPSPLSSRAPDPTTITYPTYPSSSFRQKPSCTATSRSPPSPSLWLSWA